MATTTHRVQQSGVPPVLQARWALFAFVAVNVVIIEVLFLTAGAGDNGTLTVAKFFGMHAALLIMFQLLLVARLPWLDRRIGMDRLTVWHRWVGFTLLWTILAHATLIVAGRAQRDNTSVGSTLSSLVSDISTLLGISAAITIVVVAAVSTRYVRRRLSYDTWHALHLLVYLALGLTFVHQLIDTATFGPSVFATVYWWALWLGAFGALVVGRLAVPLRRNARQQFHIQAVVPESHNVVSVYVTGRHLDELPVHAGQFFIWRFTEHNHWWVANPFSLSAAPNGRTLRLTAKAVGTTSAGLRRLPVGSRVFMEGPYGAFTSLHRTCPGALFIAGGVGITPVRALLEEQHGGDTIVLYRVRDPRDAVLFDEVRRLAPRVHLLTGRTADGAHFFAPATLRSAIPDITQRDIYVCGPPAMTAAVLDALKKLGVPATQVHAEKFNLA